MEVGIFCHHLTFVDSELYLPFDCSFTHSEGVLWSPGANLVGFSILINFLASANFSHHSFKVQITYEQLKKLSHGRSLWDLLLSPLYLQPFTIQHKDLSSFFITVSVMSIHVFLCSNKAIRLV